MDHGVDVTWWPIATLWPITTSQPSRTAPLRPWAWARLPVYWQPPRSTGAGTTRAQRRLPTSSAFFGKSTGFVSPLGEPSTHADFEQQPGSPIPIPNPPASWGYSNVVWKAQGPSEGDIAEFLGSTFFPKWPPWIHVFSSLWTSLCSCVPVFSLRLTLTWLLPCCLWNLELRFRGFSS